MYRNYTWQEASPGQWERDVDESEQFYTSLARTTQTSGRMFFAITAHSSISCAVPEDNPEWHTRLDDALRNAWLSLRYDQPTIASHVEWQPAKQRLIKVYDTSDLNLESILESKWLSDTFQLVDGFNNGQHWCNNDPPVPKLPSLFVIRPTKSSIDNEKNVLRRDLVIRSPHDIMDGIGSLTLLGHLLSLASTAFNAGQKFLAPEFGDEWKRLSPPLPVALGLSSTPSKRIESLYHDIVTQNKHLTENVNVLTLPYKLGALSPGKHQRVEDNLSALQTSQLLSACKKLEASVTHVYHAAAVITLGLVQPRQLSGTSARYINYALVNLRPRCEGEYKSSQYAASVYHCVSPNSLVIDTTIPSSEVIEGQNSSGTLQKSEFLRVLEHMKTFYHGIRDDQQLSELSGLVWKNAVPVCSWDDSEPPSIPPPGQTPTVSISSMGVVDKLIQRQYTSFQVHNPWVTGEELGNGLGLFLGTFRDELSLSAAFNEAWHDVDEIEDFLQRCHKVVLHGLQIGSG